MFKLLKTVFKTGDTTVKYPFKPLDVDPNMRGRPAFNAEQCIVCAACTMACPANALTMRTNPENGDRTWSLFLARCIFCGRCEEVCPTKAIRLTTDFELAVTNKNDLLQETTFPTINCRHCHQPFTSYKELNYAIALLKQSGLTSEQIDNQRDILESCPECRRQISLDKISNMGKVMHSTLSAYDVNKEAKDE